MALIQPPEVVPVEGHLIFIAGPIQGAPDWQAQAADLLNTIDPSITVASPRKDYPDGTFVYEEQVDWETHYLRLAGKLGVVCFWLASQAEETPGRAYAQTTRFELAEWMMRHQFEGARITIGIDEGFSNARYIRRRFAQDCPDVQIADTLEEMCRNAIALTRQ